MKKHLIAVNNVISVKNEKWCLDYKTNALSTIDWESNTIHVKAYFSKAMYEGYPKVYGDIVYSGGKIVAVPEAPIPIAIYDVDKKIVTYVDYEMNYKDFPGKIFSSAIVNGNAIYFIPCCFNSIIKMDVKTLELTYYSLEEYIKESTPAFLWDGYVETESGFVFTTYNSNKVLQFEYETGKISKLISVPFDGIVGVADCGSDRIMIVPMEAKNVCYYSLADGSLKETIVFPNDFVSGKFSFSKIVKRGDAIFLLPRTANMIVVLDKDGSVKTIPVRRDKSADYYEKYYPCSDVESVDGKWILFTENEGIICYDEELRNQREVTFEIDVEHARRTMDSLIKEDQIWNAKWFTKNI